MEPTITAVALVNLREAAAGKTAELAVRYVEAGLAVAVEAPEGTDDTEGTEGTEDVAEAADVEVAEPRRRRREPTGE